MKVLCICAKLLKFANVTNMGILSIFCRYLRHAVVYHGLSVHGVWKGLPSRSRVFVLSGHGRRIHSWNHAVCSLTTQPDPGLGIFMETRPTFEPRTQRLDDEATGLGLSSIYSTCIGNSLYSRFSGLVS